MTCLSTKRPVLRHLGFLLGTTAFIGITLATSLAQAQTAPATQPSGSTASADSIEDVVVTATRREENLQQVPIAVSVVEGDWASAHDLNDLQDISTAVPSVDFRTGASNKDRDIFIRGIGTITTSPGVEPSVSTVIDGVVYARPGQATLDLLDIDHIEVLRGPQGTLFGKNASAGVINILTTNPTDNFHAFADSSFYGGSGDEYRLEAGVSGTLIPGKVTGLISALTSGYNGNVTNLYNGSRVNGYSHNGVRTKLVITPDQDVKITLAADYLASRDTVPTGVFSNSTQAVYPTGAITASAPLAAALAAASIVPSSDNTQISADTPSHTNDNNAGGSVTVDWSLGDYTLTSISAYRYWDNHQLQDYDQLSQLTTTIPAVVDNGRLLFNQTSEEARIASPKGGLIDYVAGFYYMNAVDNELYQRSLTTLSGVGTTTSNNGASRYGTHGNNYALFGEANINFAPNFRAIAGFRVIRDDLDYHFNRVSTSAVAVTAIQPAFTSSGSTGDWGYADRLGLQYDIDTDTNTYFTYSHGYTGPAYNVFFNMAATATNALNPETSNSYEIGLKSKLLGNSLQLNLAGFITDFDNYQANFADVVAGALVTRLINAGSVSTKGVEADLVSHPVHNLTLSGSLAWTEAQVDNFTCPPNAASSCNINGQPLPFAPSWKLGGDANYIVPLTDSYNLIADTDFRWQSKVQYQLTETPDTVQDGYGIWNGGLTLADNDDDQKWRASVLVKNILDTHYSSYLAHGDLAGVVRWVPRDDSRYFGIDLRKEF